jgi:hypothetical protein
MTDGPRTLAAGPMTTRTTVAVIGGGPAGASCATALARAGVAVTLVEAGDGGGNPFGESLAPSATPLLHRLGLLDAVLATNPLPCHGNRSIWGSEAPEERGFLRDPLRPGLAPGPARLQRRPARGSRHGRSGLPVPDSGAHGRARRGRMARRPRRLVGTGGRPGRPRRGRHRPPGPDRPDAGGTAGCVRPAGGRGCAAGAARLPAPRLLDADRGPPGRVVVLGAAAGRPARGGVLQRSRPARRPRRLDGRRLGRSRRREPGNAPAGRRGWLRPDRPAGTRPGRQRLPPAGGPATAGWRSATRPPPTTPSPPTASAAPSPGARRPQTPPPATLPETEPP